MTDYMAWPFINDPGQALAVTDKGPKRSESSHKFKVPQLPLRLQKSRSITEFESLPPPAIGKKPTQLLVAPILI